MRRSKYLEIFGEDKKKDRICHMQRKYTAQLTKFKCEIEL